MRQTNRHHRSGSAVLEAALVTPLLLLLIMGGLEWGLFIHAKQTLQQAARAGARAGIAENASNADIDAAIDAALAESGWPDSAVQTQVRVNGGVKNASNANPGDRLEVALSLSWDSVGTRLWGVVPSGKQVQAAAAMRRE